MVGLFFIQISLSLQWKQHYNLLVSKRKNIILGKNTVKLYSACENNLCMEHIISVK